MLLLGDCNDHLKQINDNSIDLIVTDPPYGIEFMGKDWDKALVSKETWKECYRVLKQGKIAFVMCSPRQDVLSRMIINLQDAGFRVNYTSIYHSYASGFPKAKNNKDGSYSGFQPKPAVEIILVVSKGKTLTWLDDCRIPYQSSDDVYFGHHNSSGEDTLFNDTPIENNVYQKGWRRQPNNENEKGRFPANLLVSDDVLNDGRYIAKGFTNFANFKWVQVSGYQCLFCGMQIIGWCLIGKVPWQCICQQCIAIIVTMLDLGIGDKGSYSRYFDLDAWFKLHNVHKHDCKSYTTTSQNYAPIHDDHNSCTSYNNKDDASIKSNKKTEKRIRTRNHFGKSEMNAVNAVDHYPDTRFPATTANVFPFLIVPKASKSEKNEGCSELEGSVRFASENESGKFLPTKTEESHRIKGNSHPTVKPLKLMSYLITMGSREGDLVLDPFCGSGTVCIAADNLHRKWIGVEKNPDYAQIIKSRLMVPLSQLKLTIYDV